MKQVENNAYFWQKLDTLFVSATFSIIHSKHSTHSVYKNLVYPVNYGVIKDAHSYGNTEIGVFKGSNDIHRVDAIAVSIDTLERDADIKLLVGCNEEETYKIMQFLNETEFQKSILVRRSDEISEWAIFE